ncbi:MAG: polysaccharide deacetylase [Clostridiales bacterium]|nr:polysaccharide deacetylase [Clostridiales bacterium]
MVFENNKNKAVTFSYDDGVTQDIRLIELLNKYGLKCTFNLNSGLLSQKGILMREGNRVSHYKIHKDDVKYVYDGHEIAVHTLTHPDLTSLGDEEIICQVEEDRVALSDIAGYNVVGMAYPCGTCNRRVADIIKDNTGVKYARTISCTKSFDVQEDIMLFNPTLFHLDFDDMMRMGEEFITLNADTPKILYVWGHAYEMDYNGDYWVRLEEFFKLISNRDDVFYGTNKEVLLP